MATTKRQTQSKPEATQPAKPEVTEPAKPEVTTPAPAEVTEPPKPEVTAGAPAGQRSDEASAADAPPDGRFLTDAQLERLCGSLGLPDGTAESHVLAAIALEVLSGFDAEEEAAGDDGHVVVIMRTHISGTRNGLPWPAANEPISLPVDEAEQYVRCGYAKWPTGD